MNVQQFLIQQLLVKGIEVKRIVDGVSEDCVVYLKPEQSTFYCGKRKNSATADRYSFSSFEQVIPTETSQLTFVFSGNVLVLDFTTQKVRDYLATMMPVMFQ
jgi:hypothetical protein